LEFLSDSQKLGFRFIFGRNDFYSSGQLPKYLIYAGKLDLFGYIDESTGRCCSSCAILWRYSSRLCSPLFTPQLCRARAGSHTRNKFRDGPGFNLHKAGSNQRLTLSSGVGFSGS
jgi:hypothetical protein